MQGTIALQPELPAPVEVPPVEPTKSMKGGEGSGNFGHEGRPGEVGGSGEGGGSGEDGGSGEGGGDENPAHIAYDALYNEGGEGYNPHPAYNPSPYDNPTFGEKRDSINRRLNAIDYNAPENNDRITALRQEYDKTYITEGWTKEVTLERRGRWNAAIKSGEYTTAAGKITAAAKGKIESTLGFDFETLKEAVRIHGG